MVLFSRQKIRYGLFNTTYLFERLNHVFNFTSNVVKKQWSDRWFTIIVCES